MAARMPMTTMTTSNSTIVKPCFTFLLGTRLARLNFSDGGSSTMVNPILECGIWLLEFGEQILAFCLVCLYIISYLL
jgi:hypothetical protein